MNPGSLAAPGPIYRSDSAAADDPKIGGSPSGGPERAWAWTRRPIVLRLPTGLAVMLGLTFLLILVLAYWAGQTRGRRQATALTGTESGQRVAHRSDLNVVEAGSGLSNNPNPRHRGQDRPGTDTGQSSGRRQAGLNYFVLAHYPKADAQRLVIFLHGYGVEAAAFRPHNRRLFQVVALEGIGRDDIDGPVRRQFEQKLRQLGRAWKTQRHGPDFSQTGIYLDLYENESVAETLVIEGQL